MSLNGLQSSQFPLTLDGTSSLDVSSLTIGGQNVDLSNLVPYTGANQTVDLGSQIVKTTHTATTNPELVNLGLLNTTISNLSIAITGTFLDKVTTTPQTVIGNVSYTAQLSADDLLVPTTKKASLGSVLTVDANYRRSETDATVSTVQYFGSITSSMGIYQATSTQNYAILQLADLGVAGTGKRTDIVMNWNINEPSYNSSIQLFASDNGTTINQYLTTTTVSFTPSDSLYKVMEGTFVPAHRYICALCITANPSGVQTVRWYGLQLDEQGVDITALTMSAQGANQIPIINDKKQLVGSGVSSTKVIYLDNVSSDIQTQLNSKLNLSGNNANQDIILGGYKVQSTATPTVADDLTRKGYVDSAIASAGASYVLKAGDTATGTIYNSAGDFHPYRGGDTNRGVILTANDADGATYATNNGGLASWFGISFRSTFDSTTRYIFNTRDGNSSQTGKHTVNALNIDGQTASRVAILDGSKNLVSSSVTTTTLGYLDATSSIQGQLNTLSGTFANYLPLTGGTISGDLVVNGANGIGLGSTAVTSGYLGPRYYLSGRGDNQDDVGADDKFGPWYGLGASGVPGFTGVPCLAGFYGLALRTGSGFMIMNDSGNIGLGTTSILGRCHIAYAGGTDFITLQNTNYTTGDYINQRFMFGTSSGTNRSAYIQGFLTSNNEADLKFFNTNSGGTVGERMIIKGDGTVGIGTGTPDTTLNVWGNLKVHDGQIGAPANGINGSTGTRIVLWPGSASATPYALGINNSTLWYGVPATGIHRWYSGLDNTMFLDGSGNLSTAGGVTCGGLQCNGTANTRHLQIERTYNINVSNGDTSQAQILFGWSGTQSQYRHNIRTGHDGGAGVGGVNNRMDFYLWGNNDAVGAIGSNRKLSINGQSTTVYARPLNVAGNNPSAVTSGNANRAGQIVLGGDEDYIGGWNAGLLMECSQQTEFNIHDYGDRVASFMYYSANTFTIGRDTGWGVSDTNINGNLQCNGGTIVFPNRGDCRIYNGSADAYSPTSSANNLIIKSWWGIGYESYDGGVRIAMDTRTGSGYYAGYVGIGTAVPTGRLEVYDGGADYTNSVVIRTPWSSVTLDNSAFGGRKWSVLSGGSGAGVGQGGFGIFDITLGAYRLGITAGGVITLYGDGVITGNQYLNTVNQPSQTTFGNTENRLLFRDPGTGLTTTGACSTWYYINGSIAWTYGVNVDYAFYVPNTTCSIQINVTGSGYSGNVIGTYILVRAYAMFTGTYYDNTKPYFFNITSNHTEITAHFTIPSNAWGAQTIGWKRLEFYWFYNSGGSISSDSNDTLNWDALVIG